MDLLRSKAKELFLNHGSPTTKGAFHLLTVALLSLLLPLSFLLLATLSGAQYYLQNFTLYNSHEPFPFLLSLALHVNPCVLYVLVSIVSIVTLIHGLTGKVTLSSREASSSSLSISGLQPRLYIAWILLCSFQVCVGLGIEGSIAAGIYDTDELSFGAERSLISRMIFLLGLHETTQVWSRMVVRPVVDDTVFGSARKERWIERVAMAGSLSMVWWWRLREEVETLVVMAEAKKEQLMEVGMVDFVGWWLYYLTVTIGMVRIVKGVIWMFMIPLCRRRTRQVESSSENDDKVQI